MNLRGLVVQKMAQFLIHRIDARTPPPAFGCDDTYFFGDFMHAESVRWMCMGYSYDDRCCVGCLQTSVLHNYIIIITPVFEDDNNNNNNNNKYNITLYCSAVDAYAL